MEIQYLTGCCRESRGEPCPDTTHVVVTAGYGSYDASSENLTTNTYAPTAWVTDGSLALTYDVTGSAVRVNMAVFRSGLQCGGMIRRTGPIRRSRFSLCEQWQRGFYTSWGQQHRRCRLGTGTAGRLLKLHLGFFGRSSRVWTMTALRRG